MSAEMEGQQPVTKRHVRILREKSIAQPVVENPFTHRIHLTKCDILKVVVMSITLAPLRLILAALLLLLIWPIAAIGVACRSAEDKKKPLAGWKRGYMQIIRFVLRSIFFIFGFYHVKLKGQRATADVAPIMCVAPHSSMFDVFVFLMGSEMGSGVSRDQNAKIPIVGSIIQFLQPILVSRENSNSRLSTIEEIERRSSSGGKWPQIFIFPEGTCSNRTCLISFKGGAFFPGLPVQPVCIRYNNKPDTVTWTWDGPGGFKCVWLTLCQFHNNLEVEFLPVYKPTEEEKKDPKLYANNVRAVMAKCLELPVTDHTFDDCRLMLMATKLHLPMEAGLVEFQKLHQKLGLTFDQMKDMMDRFQAIQSNKTGQVTLEQFADYLQLPVSAALEEMFAMYDRNHSGTIDFREYVIGLSLVSNPANTEEILLDAFQRFDKGKNGYITEEELQIILRNAFGMEEEAAALLFESVDLDEDGRVTYEEFKSYAEQRPEYAKLFLTYHELTAAAKESQETSNGENSVGNNGKESRDKSSEGGTSAMEGKLKAE